jgi:hypothetical protein
MTAILATWEVEIGKTIVRGQSKQIVWKNPSPKKPRANGVEVWLKRVEHLLCKNETLSLKKKIPILKIRKEEEKIKSEQWKINKII